MSTVLPAGPAPATRRSPAPGTAPTVHVRSLSCGAGRLAWSPGSAGRMAGGRPPGRSWDARPPVPGIPCRGGCRGNATRAPAPSPACVGQRPESWSVRFVLVSRPGLRMEQLPRRSRRRDPAPSHPRHRARRGTRTADPPASPRLRCSLTVPRAFRAALPAVPFPARDETGSRPTAPGTGPDHGTQQCAGRRRVR